MKRSRLRNKYLKSKSLTDRKHSNLQRNLCKELLRTTKKGYLNNLDIKKVTDNRTFGELLFLIKIQKVIKFS